MGDKGFVSTEVLLYEGFVKDIVLAPRAGLKIPGFPS